MSKSQPEIVKLSSSKSDNDNKEKDVTNSKYDDLIKKFKDILGEKVKDVRISKKLTDSPKRSLFIRYFIHNNKIISFAGSC